MKAASPSTRSPTGGSTAAPELDEELLLEELELLELLLELDELELLDELLELELLEELELDDELLELLLELDELELLDELEELLEPAPLDDELVVAPLLLEPVTGGGGSGDCCPLLLELLEVDELELLELDELELLEELDELDELDEPMPPVPSSGFCPPDDEVDPGGPSGITGLGPSSLQPCIAMALKANIQAARFFNVRLLRLNQSGIRVSNPAVRSKKH